MEKKSLLEFLDEVAKEEYMEDSVDLCRIHAIQDPETSVDHVFKEAGKRYAKQYLMEAYNNIDSDKVFTKSGVDWSELFQSITNTEIDT